ncbi:Kinesin-like protein kif21b [Blomia tropicalis]|nr:Kinesin-like protein kif21b [Blomia tropicalis]
MSTSSNVNVAIRIRPMLRKELNDASKICTRTEENQVWISSEKAFTFDHVFDVGTEQSIVYEKCVQKLVDGCFHGFNATVLAYGQTGSGKTYTMGTNFEKSASDHQKGIIPRAIYHLFAGIQKQKEQAKADNKPIPEFSIMAQFIEIYNEELRDLLLVNGNTQSNIRIHEDSRRGIVLTGVTNKMVSNAEEAFMCLKNGSTMRTTGSTLMNSESSRSHAIFTLTVNQTRIIPIDQSGMGDGNCVQDNPEFVTLNAKFNFVDLAGSERLARTGAVGERAREGISINSGLLHLGNVISALSDRTKKGSHVPYRDSKLTRVLQDSLGGNSVTVMIACISPCDTDFVETLNTLRYANRAKNIKNKVVANQDSHAQLVSSLRKQILELEKQLSNQNRINTPNNEEFEFSNKKYLALEQKHEETILLFTQLYEKAVEDSLIPDSFKKDLEEIKEFLYENSTLVDSQSDLTDYDCDEEQSLSEDILNAFTNENEEYKCLNQDIENKEKLIAEAEIHQKEIAELTSKFENQIFDCQNKIKHAEAERDKVLLLLKKASKSEEKKLKAEYDRKLLQCQQEIRKLEKIKNEHQKYIRNDLLNQKKINQMKQEILESKKNRVKMISQLKEQHVRHHKELQKNKVIINKLTKQENQKEVKIQDLERKTSIQKKMLQKREDEIKHLRKQVRPISGNVKRINKPGSTPKHVRSKWNSFEKRLNNVISSKLLFNEYETELNRLMLERSRKMEDLTLLKQTASCSSDHEYLENIQSNIDYLTNCIRDQQTMMVELAEEDDSNLIQLLNEVNASDIYHFAYKTINLFINSEFKKNLKTIKTENMDQWAEISSTDSILEQTGEHKLNETYAIKEQRPFDETNAIKEQQPFDDSYINFRRGSQAVCLDCLRRFPAKFTKMKE